MADITERDANCKNCLHVRVCAFRNSSEDEKVCSQFINKADVVEVRHGEWLPQIVLGERVWDCSECKTLGSPHWKRCPVCEAKMDGVPDTNVVKMDGKGEGE